MILVDRDHVYTLHLKEFYWSKLEIQKLGKESNLSWDAYFVRPGLVVDIKKGSRWTDLKTLTWEISEGGHDFLFKIKSKSVKCSSQELLSKESRNIISRREIP